MKTSGSQTSKSPSELIDARIEELGDWRGKTLSKLRTLAFAKGAHLKDPSRLFNSSLEGNTRRAVDFHEGERINEAAARGGESPGSARQSPR